MGRRRKRWKFSAGQRPHTVTVFERSSNPDGPLYVRVWCPQKRAGRGGWRKSSLGHRDKARAKAYALEQSAKLEQGVQEIRAGKVTLARLLALYQEHRTPRKSAHERTADARRSEMWARVLGPQKDPHKITKHEWEAFQDARLAGAIDARGRPVPEGKRTPVRARTVEADCKWLRWVFNWGASWRDRVTEEYLLRENAVRGFEIPTEKNPRRPVASQDRLEAIRAKSDEVTMEVRWSGKRTEARSYVSELLDIANGTGRRISAICALRYSDLRGERSQEAPHGAIRWPADTDKEGRESTVPIGPDVRRALDRILSERPGIGDTPLFPSPEDPRKPISRHLADAWLREAEEKAGVPPQRGSLWHAYRRKWATERKHLPLADVAKVGGWAGAETLQRAYQQADAETMLQVVLGAGELRERKA